MRKRERIPGGEGFTRTKLDNIRDMHKKMLNAAKHSADFAGVAFEGVKNPEIIYNLDTCKVIQYSGKAEDFRSVNLRDAINAAGRDIHDDDNTAATIFYTSEAALKFNISQIVFFLSSDNVSELYLDSGGYIYILIKSAEMPNNAIERFFELYDKTLKVHANDIDIESIREESALLENAVSDAYINIWQSAKKEGLFEIRRVF